MNDTPRYRFTNARPKLTLCIIQAVYFAFCFVILSAIPRDLPYIVGADAASWLEPAKSLLLHKDYVIYDRPEYDLLYRAPVVPTFNAFFLWLGGNEGVTTIVMAQLVLLSVTSLLIAMIAESIKRGTGWVAMCLFLINPNSLSAAFLIQSETVFVFFLTFSAYTLLQYSEKCRWRDIILSSSFLALATLARPTTQYLIAMFPLACWFLLIVRYKRIALTFKRFSQGTVATGLAILLVMPWALKLAQSEGVPTLTTAEIRSVYIHDQLLTLESYRAGISIDEANAKLSEKKNRNQKTNCGKQEYKSSARASCFQTHEKSYISQLFGYPVREYVRPIIKSFANFFFSGSSGNWHNLLEAKNQSKLVTIASNVSDQQSVAMATEILMNFGFLSILITLFCLLFSVSLKVMSLFGVFDLIKRRQFAVLTVCLALIAYFFATTLFLGQSRYRVPVEPYFTVLATFGLVRLLEAIHGKRKQK